MIYPLSGSLAKERPRGFQLNSCLATWIPFLDWHGPGTQRIIIAYLTTLLYPSTLAYDGIYKFYKNSLILLPPDILDKM